MYFTPEEFRGWWSLMDPRWLVCADLLREFSGLVIDISPVSGAIGRHTQDSWADHNVDVWKQVFGVDTLPRWLDPALGNASITQQATRFYELAVRCGFSAIGYYPDWTDWHGRHHPGFHLGTRRDRKAGDPAVWGRLKRVGQGGYEDVTINRALAETELRIV